MQEKIVYCADEAETLALGQKVAQAVLSANEKGGIIYLQGDLGAGKTTFSRGLIQALGHRGAVKSPTYTLVEPYERPECLIYHFDLYRLADPEELEFIGIRDYFEGEAGLPVIGLIEWPDKGRGVIPEPDLVITLTVETLSGEATPGRDARLQAISARGEGLLSEI